LSSNYF